MLTVSIDTRDTPWIRPCTVLVQKLKVTNNKKSQKFQPLAGLEPTIPCLGGRCLIHQATEAGYSLQILCLFIGKYKTYRKQTTRGDKFLNVFKRNKFRDLKVNNKKAIKMQPLAGLEPAIPCLGGRCLIHQATEASPLPQTFPSEGTVTCIANLHQHKRQLQLKCIFIGF